MPLVALVAWLATVGHKPAIFNTFAGSPLGGHLTQAEAKAIDVVTSAPLVPLVMAGFNLVWFASARVCMASEAPPPGKGGGGTPGQQGGIPFKTLAVASTVGAGTYSPMIFHSLLQGRRWSMKVLVAMTLCSAVAMSSFSNIVAYEAFAEA